MTFGGLIGFVASFLQMLEKLTLLKNAHSVLSCNLNSVFNCSNILNAHQSSVFGFPNSLLCITFFAVVSTVGVIGWTGSQIHKYIRFSLQAASIFFVGFGFWYFWQSIFNVGALCAYCSFCFGGVLLVNWAWLRLNYLDYGRYSNSLKRFVYSGGDIFLWIMVALIIVLEAIIKFR